MRQSSFRRITNTLAIVCLAVAAAHAESARDIVRKSVTLDLKDEGLLRQYTWNTLSETKILDPSSGKLRSSESEREELVFLGGRIYTHRLEKNHHALPPAEAAKEQAKMNRAAAEAAKLSPKIRRQREQETVRHPPTRFAARASVADAFDFEMKGEDEIEGRAAWKIHATPIRDYKGQGSGVFRNIEGDLWIDRKEYVWLKMDATALDNIAGFLFLAHISKGAHLVLENSKVNDEVWAARHFGITADMSLTFFKLTLQRHIFYSDYRKFQTDSHIDYGEEAETKH